MSGADPAIQINQTAHPPRWAALRWLQLNMTMLVFAWSVISASVGVVITAATRASDVTHDIASVQKTEIDIKAAMLQTHADMVDVDRRLNAANAMIVDVLRQQQMHDAALELRIAVLEAQLKFVADRLPTPQFPARR